MKIGRITFEESGKSDKMGAEIERVIGAFFHESTQFVNATANDPKQLRAALVRLCDVEKCPLVLTLGGSGPGSADVVPDITREVADRELPGFGEIIRYYSYERFKVAVLSRGTAGVRGQSLIINLPGKPKPVKFCLKLLQEGIAEGVNLLSSTKLTLRGDEIVVPIDKYIPFLKKIRPRPDPDGEKHPTIGG